MNDNNYAKSLTFLILAQSMVALNIVISKFLLTSIPVFVLLAIRFSFASLVLIPLHFISAARKIPMTQHLKSATNKDWTFFAAQALCAGVLFNCLMLTGLNHTDANLAGIITSALPALIALLSWLILGEKLSSQKALCILFATIGLIIVAYSKLKGPTQHHSFFGDFVVLLALLPEAGYYILCKLHSGRLPVFLTSSLMNGINAIILIPAIFLSHWDPSSISLANWAILLIISLSSGLFYVFWFVGSRNVDGVMASLSTAIMPISTAIFAWIILSEKLSGLQILGMGLVVLSISLYAKR